MKDHKQGFWIGVGDKNKDPEIQKAAEREFKELPIIDGLGDDHTVEALKSNRRDFLKFLGFGLGAATVAAGCDTPVRKAIPYVIKPDAIVPGVATYYASTYTEQGDYCSVLVKTREGRPIKIEGNALSPVTKGGTNARAQASVLSLYDYNRFNSCGRMAEGRFEAMDWEELDQEITQQLSAKEGMKIYLLSPTILSPSYKAAIEEFLTRYPGAEFVTYDPVSSSAILQANAECFNDQVIPSYHFDKAKVIVSFDADFLGTWISPVEFAKQYAGNRKVKDIKNPEISWHVQVESAMSLTGSNADNRILVKPSEQGAAIANLYNEVADLVGESSISAPTLNDKAAKALKKVAGRLVANKGEALVVSGSNNAGEQVLINKINDMIGSYGATIDFAEASLQRQGVDSGIRSLVRAMNQGAVDALFVLGGNPAYDLPDSEEFKAGMEKVGLKVAFHGAPNDTTALCDYIAPTHHYLESWGDAVPRRGHYSLVQPTIAPLFKTRQAPETLLRWAVSDNLKVEDEQPYYEYLKARWEAENFPQQSEFATFNAFWDNVLHDGVFHVPQDSRPVTFAGDVAAAAAKIRKPAGEGLEVVFHETVNMGAGQYADNPWLMEMPDPITRCVWGNYLSVPVEWDGKKFVGYNNLKNEHDKADKAKLEINGRSATCVVVPTFGLMKETAALALGYGRQVTGECGRGVGVDVTPWLQVDPDGNTQYYATAAALSGKQGEDEEFACVQYHHTMGVQADDPEVNVDELAVVDFLGIQGYQGALTDRSILYHSNVKHVDELAHHIEEKRAVAEELNSKTLYPYEEYKEKFYSQGHHWGMHVDMNACIGCGACTVACMAENNVPVVGKREIHRHHEMTWLRIDRYFYGDVENPSVVYQPMMCQHCDNAPCENVCPVNATNHSSEGLNQMTYNRCVGTRYCANNCPYKVRRFNWLDYTTADTFPQNEYYQFDSELPFYAHNLTRMVLNPDVTVRSRGVIEKCSFCVQRIQEGKLRAKSEKRVLQDRDVKTACQTACPTGAIIFGDMNNEKSTVAKQSHSPLVYQVLEEGNFRPSVNYAAKVTNRDEELNI